MMTLMKSTAAKHEVPVIDLSGLLAEPGSEKKYISQDGLHFTAEGNRAIAEKLSDY